MQLIQKYVKSNGYIGSGMHSWDNWRGTVLHETPLQDGETAARLLCYYAVPKEHPIVENFVKAMRDEKTMKKEFSYIPPEIERYNNRWLGIRNGNCLGALLYTMQALLGYGDDFDDLVEFQQTALKIEYPTPYVDVRLEESYKNDYGLDCDLTFWAVQFNEIVRENSQGAF